MLAVWNCLIGASPLIMLGMLKVSFSKGKVCKKKDNLPTPFFRSINITSDKNYATKDMEYVGKIKLEVEDDSL